MRFIRRRTKPSLRNIFDASPDTDMELLATITSYTRRVLSGLSNLDDEVIYAAHVTFGLPEEETKTVKAKSHYVEKLAKNADVSAGDT
jgi:cytochrome b pre-mRNA-processing protein 3